MVAIARGSDGFVLPATATLKIILTQTNCFSVDLQLVLPHDWVTSRCDERFVHTQFSPRCDELGECPVHEI